jgi:hypothetical protein
VNVFVLFLSQFLVSNHTRKTRFRKLGFLVIRKEREREPPLGPPEVGGGASPKKNEFKSHKNKFKIALQSPVLVRDSLFL